MKVRSPWCRSCSPPPAPARTPSCSASLRMSTPTSAPRSGACARCSSHLRAARSNVERPFRNPVPTSARSRMTPDQMIRRPAARRGAALSTTLLLSLALTGLAADASAQTDTTAAARDTSAARDTTATSSDPRIGLRAGVQDAGEALGNLELVAHRAKPEGFFNPASVGDFAFANSDLAFSGSLLFLGGYNGIQIWDISKPNEPTLRSSLVCPG